MRSAPVVVNRKIAQVLDGKPAPRIVLATDMLDVPTWLGFVSREAAIANRLNGAKLITYFHENQWMYPVSPDAREDHHFGYTNLLTALISDACWFNSRFHRDGFLDHSESFLRRMPDSIRDHDLERIRVQSRIIAPGFDPVVVTRNAREKESSLRIGWVGRFEHDKRPDRFLELLNRIDQAGLDFKLVLLGERGRSAVAVEELQRRFATRILHNGFESTEQGYWKRLAEIDVVVSTADHEFFGIGICEAIWAGALPVVPDDLSYPEFVPDSLRYRTLDEAVRIIRNYTEETRRTAQTEVCRNFVRPYHSNLIAERIDDAFEAVLID